MRTVLMVLALVSSVACGSDSVAAPDTQSPDGIWALKTVQWRFAPIHGTPVGNAVDRVTDGTITFVAPSYVIDITIIRTIGDVVYNQKFYEIGSYTSDATGIVLRPNDVPGGTGIRLPAAGGERDEDRQYAELPAEREDPDLREAVGAGGGGRGGCCGMRVRNGLGTSPPPRPFAHPLIGALAHSLIHALAHPRTSYPRTSSSAHSRVGRAHAPNRTLATPRHSRRAHQRAELHQRLIVRPRRLARTRQQFARDRPHALLPAGRFEIRRRARRRA